MQFVTGGTRPRSRGQRAVFITLMAALEGLEPPTQGLGRPRSVHLNYRARTEPGDSRLLASAASILNE